MGSLFGALVTAGSVMVLALSVGILSLIVLALADEVWNARRRASLRSGRTRKS